MLNRLIQWLVRRHEERRMYRELRRLDDRMLRDIGLDRYRL